MTTTSSVAPTRTEKGRLRAALLVAVLVVLPTAAGCASESEATLTRAELPQLVLQPADIAGSWLQFDEGAQSQADAPVGERADPARFGRIEGWKARYRRPGSAETRGPLVIESRTDLFDDADGAHEELEAARRELEALEGGKGRVRETAVGDEALTFSSPSAPRGHVRYFTVVWRDDNATATIAVNGFQGGLQLEDALRLARKQQARIARAAADQ